MDLGYFSHFPVLAAAIRRAPGPILEMGCGHGSTHLIHLLAGGDEVRTFDSDTEWLGRFSAIYGSDRHLFAHVNFPVGDVRAAIATWSAIAELYSRRPYAVAFLDMAPGEARVPVAKILKDSVTYLVCHDTEADDPPGGGNYGWRELDATFRYRSRFERLRPFTTVYSNVREFDL